MKANDYHDYGTRYTITSTYGHKVTINRNFTLDRVDDGFDPLDPDVGAFHVTFDAGYGVAGSFSFSDEQMQELFVAYLACRKEYEDRRAEHGYRD